MASEAPQAPEYATLTEDDQVIGEGVALDLPAAGIGPRIASGLIDLAVGLVLLIALLLLLIFAAVPGGEAIVYAATIIGTVGALVVFPATLETLTRGRSLGKLALGLRTVRDDGGPITAQHAITRALIGYVEIYALQGVAAGLAILCNRRGKRLGDYAAGTYVVRDRARLSLPRPIMMPPRLAAWAGSADITDLPPPLAVACRQYLGRVHQITPASRATLGAELAGRLSAYVAPMPPFAVPPEEFIAAVLATRRDRDLARLRREDALRERLARHT